MESEGKGCLLNTTEHGELGPHLPLITSIATSSRGKEVKGLAPARAVPALSAFPNPLQGEGHGWDRMFQSLLFLHSAFLGTRPILVRIFLKRKKATVLTAQITSATQKAVLQL